MLILPSPGGRRYLPVKIFSGVDYIVEKSVNSFVKNVRVLDVRISSHSHKDSSRVTVLILYEGGAGLPAHASGPGLGGGPAAA